MAPRYPCHTPFAKEVGDGSELLCDGTFTVTPTAPESPLGTDRSGRTYLLERTGSF